MIIEENNQLYTIEKLQQTAVEYFADGKYDEAILVYEQCIELEPNIISNYWYLGLNLLISGDKLQAQIIWSSIIENLEDERDDYINQLLQVLLEAALNFIQADNLSTAEEIYKQILEIDPTCILASTNIGLIYSDQCRWYEGIDYFQKLMENYPNCPGFYKEMGILSYQVDELDAAIVYLSKVIEILPDFIQVEKLLNHTISTIKARKAGYGPKVGGYKHQIWDPFLLKEKDKYRLFYLNSEHITSRFWMYGEIASATSIDMENWDYIGVIHRPNPNLEWESGRILACTVYQENEIYYMFYPASPSGLNLLHERISLATSSDGKTWQRVSSFLVQSDTRFYTYSCNFQFINTDETFKIDEHWQWRDPYIVKEELSGKYYMFITAASVESTSYYFKGCIALAIADTIDGKYEILPPAALPILEGTKECIFYEMERPQVIYKYNKYHLFFSCRSELINPKWLDQIGIDKITDSSLYWYTSEHITGPFKPAMDIPVVQGSDKTGLYAINFIEHIDGKLIAYGWYFKYILEVSPKFLVHWDKDSIRILVD